MSLSRSHTHIPLTVCSCLFFLNLSYNTLCNPAPLLLGWARLFRELAQMLRAKRLFRDAQQRSKLLNQSRRLRAQRLRASRAQVERKKSKQIIEETARTQQWNSRSDKNGGIGIREGGPPEVIQVPNWSHFSPPDGSHSRQPLKGENQPA